MSIGQEVAMVMLTPFFAAVVVGVTIKRWPWMRWLPFGLISGLFLLCLDIYRRTLGQAVQPVSWFTLESIASFYVQADPLATYFSLIICGVGMMTLLYAAASLPKGISPASFFVAMLASLGSCLGIAFAGDLFTLYIFFEILAVSSYLLVILDGSVLAMRAGYRYLILSLMAGLSVLGASLLVHANIGTVAFADGPLITEAAAWTPLAFFLFLGGFGLKAGMFPLHIWLPDAHASAPAPASAILSGILLKCGAIGLIRALYYVFTPETAGAGGGNAVLIGLAVASIVIGSLGALVRFELKRLLAYSSIGQMGYILLGIALQHPLALTAALFHMSAHAILKSCLFLSAGTMIEASGKKDARDLDGLSTWLPVTSAAFSVAALGMIGIPPLNGFISKYFLGLGALEASMSWGLVVLLASSFLNVLYYSPILIRLYCKKREEPLTIKRETLQLTGVVVGLLALTCLLFGLGPLNAPFSAATEACLSLIGGH